MKKTWLDSIGRAIITAIKAKTDNLPAAPADQATSLAVKAKTDNLPASPADEVTLEIAEDHLHNVERWFGKSADQSGNNWGVSNTMTPYQAVSGNNTWGTSGAQEAKVLGTADTPIFAGGTHQDIRRVLSVANSSNTIYRIRLIFGLTTSADAITAGQYSEFVYLRAAGDSVRKVAELQNIRVPSGYKRWIQIWNATNGATLDFFLGIHEYPPPF